MTLVIYVMLILFMFMHIEYFAVHCMDNKPMNVFEKIYGKNHPGRGKLHKSLVSFLVFKVRFRHKVGSIIMPFKTLSFREN